jgi:glycosyltransferase involved in cell wall biosynthesis
MRISVVIPTFMEEHYIATLLSQLAKTEPPIEIVVVDSLSQDKTAEIAKRFTKKVYQIKERGIAKARNYGANHASGSLIVFLDADVKLPPNFAEKLYETFKDAKVVGATCNIMPGHGTFFEKAFFKFYNLLIRITAKFEPHSRGEFFAVRKADFIRVGGFDERLPCLEDHDLANRLSKIGKFVFMGDLTVYESMRRFRKTGFSRVVGTWIVDYVFLLIHGKPLSKVWQPIR